MGGGARKDTTLIEYTLIEYNLDGRDRELVQTKATREERKNKNGDSCDRKTRVPQEEPKASYRTVRGKRNMLSMTILVAA